MTKTRIAITAYLAMLASTAFVTDSTPTWIRVTLLIAILAPVATALTIWPVLLVRSLGEVPAPEGGQETRIQVLDGDAR